ncbi:MAG: toprim domain-containing protein, partial [bacterium]|nr:toprim domain-containing protein [bacterium]
MMIERDRIETIKNNVDLKDLFMSRGVNLKKSGKNYIGLCPFHDDVKPSLSVNPLENLWNCFGCDQGGDAIRFVQSFDKIDFESAVKQLEGTHVAPSKPSIQKKEKPVPEARMQKLLERVVAIYEKDFGDKARKYLSGRGITDQELLAKHRVGYCKGGLTNILPKKGRELKELENIGILCKGRERFTDCVVFPVFDVDGNISTLYGRCIEDGPRSHIYLPNRPTGLWNARIIKTCTEVILVESIIDGLSVETAGYSNVVSIQGTNGISKSLDLMKKHGVQKPVLLLDGDEPGMNAVKQLKEKITEPIETRILPEEHDPNSYLIIYGPEKLAGSIQKQTVPEKRTDPGYERFP